MSEADRLRILYVDDDKDIRHIVKLSLALDPLIELRLCADGAEALEAAADDPWRPDLVMLDVMMPGMDGPSILARMRADDALKHIPVIFMTAKVQPGEIEAYKALGAIGVIPKPFSPVDMPAEIGRLWKCAPEKASP